MRFFQLLSAVIFAIVFSANYVSAFYSPLFPIYIDGKGGYMNSTGEIVIEPRFDEVREFSEGFAEVKSGDKWGYINSSGDFAVEPTFSHVKPFSNGLALIYKDGKYGFIDEKGNYQIPSKFDKADSFSEGLARVKADGKWQFIDRLGNVKINTDFDFVDNFYNGFAVVAKFQKNIGGKVSYIDKTGKLSSIGWLNYAGRFSENLAVISRDTKIVPTLGRNGFDFDNYDYETNTLNNINYEIIDSSLNKLYEKKLSYITDFSNGLVVACLNGKCGYLDSKGNTAIAFQFSSVDDFSEDFAQVKLDNENYVIDKKGKTVFKTNGTLIRPYKDRLAKIINCGDEIFCNIRYVNWKGESVWQSQMKKTGFKF